MFTQIGNVIKSRKFQTTAGQIAIAGASIIVSTVVSSMVSKGMNHGLEALMDKIHGAEIVEAIADAVEESITE